MKRLKHSDLAKIKNPVNESMQWVVILVLVILAGLMFNLKQTSKDTIEIYEKGRASCLNQQGKDLDDKNHSAGAKK
jgi:hypothetical protein